jgi:hypothetical protein
VLEKELKDTLSCGREQQIDFFAGEVKVTLDAKPEAWIGKTGM